MTGYIKKFKSYIPEFIWEYFRLRSILKSHSRVAAYWDKVIEEYECGRAEKYSLSAKKEFLNPEKIIWQYWGQGYGKEDVPDVVQYCFDSVDRYRGDYTVVRLCDEDFCEYVDLPDYVLKKYREGVFCKAHFSDLLRLALLDAYGGVWLDATILLTAPLEEMLLQNDWFMYQRDRDQEDKKQWRRTYAYYFSWNKNFKVRVLNSVIYAQKGSRVIEDLFQLLLHYWRVENQALDYFFFQILYTSYIEKFPERNCKVVSDCLPNMLQMYLTGSYRRYSIPEILERVSIHKLSYKSVTLEDLKELFYVI